MNINIKTIPHSEQVYPTVGDWRFHEAFEDTITSTAYFPTRKAKIKIDPFLEISVSNMNNWKYELLVAVHELIEVALCKDRGITQGDVDWFDKRFEKNRKEGNIDEPGDDPKAPYRKEHFFATSIERLLASELGVDWKKYDDKINSL